MKKCIVILFCAVVVAFCALFPLYVLHGLVSHRQVVTREYKRQVVTVIDEKTHSELFTYRGTASMHKDMNGIISIYYIDAQGYQRKAQFWGNRIIATVTEE